MFKVAILIVCAVYGIACVPTVLYSQPLVIQHETNEQSQLPGKTELGEKSSSSNDLQKPNSASDTSKPSVLSLPGTRNNAERIQVRPTHFRGIENLAEKAIPEMVIARINNEYVNNSQGLTED